jgi:hypothetical protein
MPSPAAPLRAAVRSATRVDRSKIAVDVGARAAIGVALCLVVGRLSGHTLAGAVLRAWADPAAADRDALQKARHEARLARSNAEAAVTRWINEPRPTSALPPATVLAFMAAIRNCVCAVIPLHAELPAGGPGQPEAGVLGDEVEEALSVVADQVKGTSRGAGLPPLRKEQFALAATVPIGGRADSTQSASAVVLAGETDLLVDSIDAIGHLMGLVG